MRLISVTNNLDLVNFKIKFNHRQGGLLIINTIKSYNY